MFIKKINKEILGSFVKGFGISNVVLWLIFKLFRISVGLVRAYLINFMYKIMKLTM